MTLTFAEARRLGPPLVAAVVLLALGATLIWWSKGALLEANARLAASKTERSQSRERLERMSDEEREVKDKMEVYQRLGQAGILGEERRLEWADTIAKIRTSRELLDLRYRIEPQKPLVSLPGKPAGIDFYTSALKVEVALLHEGDLLAFLHDLRESGNQYTSVQRCTMNRTSVAPTAGPSLASRLRALCDIQLITIVDRAAKT